jgi:hypothetical protein
MPRAIFAFGANVAGHPDNGGSLGAFDALQLSKAR